MRKWLCGLILFGSVFGSVAQTMNENEAEHSPISYVLIGIGILAVVIIMLYRRQKRKFND